MEHTKEGLRNENLSPGDLVLIGWSTENLRVKSLKCKKAFESKGLKVNLKEATVMTSGSKGEILKSKVGLCAKCGKRVMVNSVLCTKCGKWVYGGCAKMKNISSTLAIGFVCKQCVETIQEIWEPAKELSFDDQVEFVKSFCYLGDRLNACGGNEAAVTARTRIE